MGRGGKEKEGAYIEVPRPDRGRSPRIRDENPTTCLLVHASCTRTYSYRPHTYREEKKEAYFEETGM